MVNTTPSLILPAAFAIEIDDAENNDNNGNTIEKEKKRVVVARGGTTASFIKEQAIHDDDSSSSFSSAYSSSFYLLRPTTTKTNTATTTTTMKIIQTSLKAAEFTTWYPAAKNTQNLFHSSSSFSSSHSSSSSTSLLQQAQQQILACSSSSSSSGRGSSSSSRNGNNSIDDYYISPQLIQERLIEQANKAAEEAAAAAALAQAKASEAAKIAANNASVLVNSSTSNSSTTNDNERNGGNNNNNNKDGGTTNDNPSSSPSTSNNKQAETNNQQHLLGDDGPYGPLGQYRRGFLEHLYPKALFKNTLKITLQQGIVTLANFLSEQLEGDLKRTKLIDEGQLSAREAEEQAEEWERVEWNKRWTAFPNKVLVALAKYHAVTLTLRLYESICSLFCDAQMMDKLTMDFFGASRTLANNLLTRQQQDSNKNLSTSNMTMTSAVRSQPMSVMAEMTVTTFWANILVTLADYSVHQVLLCYGYYKYYERQRKKFAESQKKLGLVRTEDDDRKLQQEVAGHLLNNSTQLFLSRGCGLVCSSIGGGVGTVVRPGWGTLMISSMAEGAAPSLVDDGSASAKAELTSDSSSKPKTE